MPVQAAPGSLDGLPGKATLPSVEAVDTRDSAVRRLPLRHPEKTSTWAITKALALTLLPFAVICAVGVWNANKGRGIGVRKSSGNRDRYNLSTGRGESSTSG